MPDDAAPTGFRILWVVFFYRDAVPSGFTFDDSSVDIRDSITRRRFFGNLIFDDTLGDSTSEIMELIEKKDQITNSNLFLIVAGTIIFSAINNLGSLIIGLVVFIFQPSGVAMFVVNFSWEIIVFLGLIVLLWRIIQSRKILISLSKSNIKFIGIVLLLLFIVGKATGYFFSTDMKNQLNSLPDTDKYQLLRFTQYIQLSFIGIKFLREVLTFIMLFVIIYQNREVRHNLDHAITVDT
jgi:hypothetical protein